MGDEMTEPVIIGGAQLWLGDCREILPSLGRVDAVVTSPPYAQQRDYSKPIVDWRALVSGALLSANYTGDAQILVNLGLIYRDGECVEYWDDLKTDMRAAGWRLFGWYVWDKCDGMGGDWHGRFAPSHEFVFHFNKQPRPAKKVLHSKLAGLVHKGNPGMKGTDGQARGYAHQGRPVQDFKIPDSVIRIVPERQNYAATEHPAVFPVLLPQLLTDAYSIAGESVCDPFMGSGTTGVACAKLGRRFIGIEIEPRYFDIACRRIEQAYAQPDLFVAPPAKAVQEKML